MSMFMFIGIVVVLVIVYRAVLNSWLEVKIAENDRGGQETVRCWLGKGSPDAELPRTKERVSDFNQFGGVSKFRDWFGLENGGDCRDAS
ncbi:hypothetical protein SODALDRAFT_143008 [Sodiomyces alkalinus F11]|uniref:Uncharacterized protein n=1 Tax=Sodiomyces alkalinus (strain CBS 110278 / VKM F-3762 / F11) TaxID=1314773 RepID=A0A3N2PZR0_SODAK|nr:hypothetical protein SODALDRAFT_143008 [Sodiomyces alkalinus F11]ROT39987.1 hypothetical protein SODALDRAFT_143008 [Sodiomyces alkalinus F11]